MSIELKEIYRIMNSLGIPLKELTNVFFLVIM